LPIISRFSRFAALAAFVLTVACGSKSPGPTGPTGPTTTAPQIACPADLTVTGVAAVSQAVTFTAPTVTNGETPVSLTCSPSSDASFPLGTTAVTCVARDAIARQATCSFNVTLKGMAIGARKFEAIGDSFTEGQNGEPGFVDPPNSYPTKLQLALNVVYPDQAVTVINRGEGGAPMSSIVEDVLRYVTADKPDVVLFEGGYNDLLGDCGLGPTTATLCNQALERVRLGFRDGIKRSKEAPRNVTYVFAATMTPPGPLQPGAQRDRRIANSTIVEANNRIRQVIASERGILVDVYPLFQGHEAEYVDTDGLHLRPAGYQAMADAFFSAIKATIPQTPLFGFIDPN